MLPLAELGSVMDEWMNEDLLNWFTSHSTCTVNEHNIVRRKCSRVCMCVYMHQSLVPASLWVSCCPASSLPTASSVE